MTDEHAHCKSACLLRLSFLHRSQGFGSKQCFIFLKMQAAAVMTSDPCKNRTDIAGQLIDTEWHVCLGETSVQILRRLQVFMSETGHTPQSFPDSIIFASMFNDISTGRVRRCKTHVQLKRMKWLLAQQESDFVVGVSVVLDRNRPGHSEERPSHQFADGEWDKLALRMRNELITSKHPVFKCSNIL